VVFYISVVEILGNRRNRRRGRRALVLFTKVVEDEAALDVIAHRAPESFALEAMDHHTVVNDDVY
jgi:hypothetical protein